jgi:cytochrome c oxidase subunit II
LRVQNNAHLPLGKVVHFQLRARDVVHGFFIPGFRLHRDAVPGMVSTVWVQTTAAGEYDLRCSQFCGTNHYQMRGSVTVDSPEAFDAWFQKAKAESF